VANLIVSAVSTFDNKGLKKATKEISVFEKNIKTLGKSFASVFAVSALIAYSKKAVAAFAADQAAAKSLEMQLKNTGYAFSAPDVEYYIANLQNLTKVLDDNLRPAFQILLTATGSITESQKALAVALDTSAATGMSLESVSSVLAAGYRGQTKGLRTLGVTLSKTAQKAGNMAVALNEIGSAYSGQAKARLDTFAGQMDTIKVSSANAAEIIGKGFTDAFAKLGNSNDVAKLGSAMEKVATTIANIVVGLGAVLGKVVQIGKAIFEKLQLDKIIGFLYSNSLINLLSKFGASQTDKPKSNFTYSLGSGAGTEIAKLQEVKARKALIAALKAEEALKKLKDKYDIDRVNLMAALNAATDEETKLRIAEKLAILDGNAAMAAKYLAERNAEQGLEELATAADDAKKALGKLAAWDPLSGLKVTEADKLNSKNLSDLAGVLGGILGGLGGIAGKAPKAVDTTNSIINGNVNPNYPGYPAATTPYDPLSSLMATTADISSAGAYNPLSGLRPTAQDIQIYIDASNMIDSDRMVDVVQNAFLTIQRQGGSTVPAGAY
jgi:uncharacterized protein YfiM (DUF2279 family)